jgi:hypothetical protein
MRWWTAGLVAPFSFLAVVMAVGCAAAPASGHAASASTSESLTAVAAHAAPPACTASQFLLGKATHTVGFGTAGTASEYIIQPARNVGGTCKLDWPGTISVAPAAGAFQSVKVLNADHGVPATIPADRALSFIVGAWWAIPGSATFKCGTEITNVTKVRIPTAEGSTEIALGTKFPVVCRSPASTSLQIKAAN